MEIDQSKMGPDIAITLELMNVLVKRLGDDNVRLVFDIESA